MADASRVAKDVALPLIVGLDIDGVPRGARDITHCRAVVMEDLIHERGFPHIRTTNQGELERWHLMGLQLGLRLGQERLDHIHKLADASPVGRADGHQIFKTQTRKFERA